MEASPIQGIRIAENQVVIQSMQCRLMITRKSLKCQWDMVHEDFQNKSVYSKIKRSSQSNHLSMKRKPEKHRIPVQRHRNDTLKLDKTRN